MLGKAGRYVRRNHLALLALFVALGGSAIAAGKIGPNGIRRNAIRSRHIKDGAVTGADVLDGGLSGADLQDGTVTAADVQKGSLTGTNIADGSLTPGDLKPESLTGGSILDGSLTGADVRAESLLGTDILNGTLTGADVLDQGLTGNDVQEGSLTGADVQNESLSGEDVFNGSLTGADLGGATVAPSNLAVIPSARVRRTTSQSIPSGSFNAIQLTSETWDNGGLHSNVNNTRLTAPIDGVYLITANVFWAANTTGRRDLGIAVNGGFVAFDARPATSAVSEVPLAVTTTYLLEAGDFVEAKVEQTSGGALNLDAGSGGSETSPEVSMTWLGPG
jgi:uncharacterized protein YjbI with pentapeptide repeats